MPKNTANLSMKLSNSSFMLMGDAGSGKTPFAAEFPSPYFFSFDKGMISVAGKDVDYDVFRDAPKGITPNSMMIEEGIFTYGSGYDAFLKQLQVIGDQIDKGQCKYKTLVFDSVTMLNTLLMNKILLKNPIEKGPKDVPQLQHYNEEGIKLKEIFETITSWPLIKILIAHIHRDEDVLSGKTTMLPLLSPKIGAKAPIYFDEVYFLEKDGTKENKPILRTASTASMRSARSRFGVPDGVPSHWIDVRKAVAASKVVLVDV